MKGSWENDRDPLASLRRGDPALYEEFVRTEAGTIVRFFRRLGASLQDAEDLTQEVFLKLYATAARYEPRQAFPAYALRVARNAWIDRGRRSAARPRTRSLSAPGDAPSPRARGEAGGRALEQVLGGDARRPAPDPGSALERGEQLARLRRAVESLSEAHASVFELAVVQGLPYQEVAEVLEIPVGTVKSRVFNAVRRLRSQLEPEEETR